MYANDIVIFSIESEITTIREQCFVNRRLMLKSKQNQRAAFRKATITAKNTQDFFLQIRGKNEHIESLSKFI